MREKASRSAPIACPRHATNVCCGRVMPFDLSLCADTVDPPRCLFSVEWRYGIQSATRSFEKLYAIVIESVTFLSTCRTLEPSTLAA